MKEVKMLMEKGISRTMALIVCWDKLSQADKESLDFETLVQVWKSFPSMLGKDEVWFFLQKKAKTFKHYVFILENTFGDKLVYFDILKKKAKTFHQKLWLWSNIDKYAEAKNDVQKNELWDCLKKKAKTLKLSAALWSAADMGSEEESEALVLLKANIKNFADCYFLLDDFFAFETSEWEEIYSIAEEKAASFADYVYLWQNESNEELQARRWPGLIIKAETLDQIIYLFEIAENTHAEECLILARKKL